MSDNGENRGGFQDTSTADLATAAKKMTLSDRVRSLRLDQSYGDSRGGRSVFPWVLVVLFLATTVAFGFKAFMPSLGGSEKPAADKTKDKVAGSGDVVL